MNEVKYAIAILKEKLANADQHNLAYQRLSIADMEAIWGVLEKSDKSYAELKAQRDALLGGFEEAIRHKDKLADELNALAAENAALKVISNDRRVFIMNGVQLGYIKVPTVETDPALETIRIAVSPQDPTPATDAYLNSVRAGAVEDAAKRLFGQGYTFEVLTRFAGQLRAGEPS